MKNRLSIPSVVGLYIAACMLVGSIFLPWWGMTFFAPQYPEGLNVTVYPTKIDGEIDIINGLNHYIGMIEISEQNFSELQFLPYVIAGMALFTVMVAITRKKSLLVGLVSLFGVGGILGIYDIQRWLYNFGNNLDPMAPIKVPPFTPPIIGDNQIANFVTHSYFTYGSFLIGLAFVLMLIPLWRDRKR